jgi:ABC-type multidrug transport system fused ATPase/permease subunit
VLPLPTTFLVAPAAVHPVSAASDEVFPPSSLQSEGSIEFEDVTLIYRPGLPAAVQSANFSIQPCDKIGVIGRTGAGKSSLVSLLFRIVDCSTGVIRVSGRDITSLALNELRRSIAIIPQGLGRKRRRTVLHASRNATCLHQFTTFILIARTLTTFFLLSI